MNCLRTVREIKSLFAPRTIRIVRGANNDDRTLTSQAALALFLALASPSLTYANPTNGDPPNVVIIFMDDLGYATAIFGKWYLGHHPKFMPTEHGFEEYYGLPYSNDMWPSNPRAIAKRKMDPNALIPWAALPMLSSTAADGVTIVNPDVQPEDQQRMTREFTERAVDFIKTHQSKRKRAATTWKSRTR